MKYRGIFEYESTEHEPPVSIDVYLHDDCVKGKIIEWEYRPLEQEPKTGHWILTDDDFVYCSECEDSYYARPIDASWYYCPHCGAKMESEV